LEILLQTFFRTCLFTLKQLPFMLGGLFLAEMMVALKWIEKLSWLTRSLMRYAHLNTRCGVSFLIAFASPMAANSSLRALFENRCISSRELFFALLVNSFPNALMHWRWWLPAIYSVLGDVGLLHFGLILVGELIRVVFFLTTSRCVLPAPAEKSFSESAPVGKTIRKAVGISLKGTWKMAVKILKIFIPVTWAVFLLADLGAFEILASTLKGTARYFPIPLEGIPIIASQLGNSLVAFAIAGNLLHQHVITARDVILTLFVGRIFAAVMVAVRMQLPAIVGIFGQKLGFRIVGARLLSAAGIDLLMISAICMLKALHGAS
jgi:hypothetical protein